ncbi:hypothetical protein P691DRAFT_784384 [Macrolepiota fuliginosa MF-IS2]|uniref:Uncharacterized protein n=1 Tax=Macrolepiota fuliginosa MF-IS2 TaxID=1400762 RepID=A0A9P6C1V8_9AGAR|nr:hypothetical protein P691DRAFT_784384 [Macrolepiota fuliginosa MF-IS2]
MYTNCKGIGSPGGLGGRGTLKVSYVARQLSGKNNKEWGDGEGFHVMNRTTAWWDFDPMEQRFVALSLQMDRAMNFVLFIFLKRPHCTSERIRQIVTQAAFQSELVSRILVKKLTKARLDDIRESSGFAHASWADMFVVVPRKSEKWELPVDMLSTAHDIEEWVSISDCKMLGGFQQLCLKWMLEPPVAMHYKSWGSNLTAFGTAAVETDISLCDSSCPPVRVLGKPPPKGP